MLKHWRRTVLVWNVGFVALAALGVAFIRVPPTGACMASSMRWCAKPSSDPKSRSPEVQELAELRSVVCGHEEGRTWDMSSTSSAKVAEA